MHPLAARCVSFPTQQLLLPTRRRKMDVSRVPTSTPARSRFDERVSCQVGKMDPLLRSARSSSSKALSARGRAQPPAHNSPAEVEALTCRDGNPGAEKDGNRTQTDDYSFCQMGAAYGGGLELMLSCDLRVAGAEAVLGLTETSLGIIPGAGGTQRLPRLIGISAAKELVFAAKRISAARALKLGIVGNVVEAGQAEKEAMSLAREIAAGGPLAVRLAKRAMDTGMQVGITEGMEVEREMYARVLRTRDRDEGLLAFKERRPPDFTGE